MDPSKDRAIVGNYAPDFTFGFSNQFRYRKFDLNFSFQGSYGSEILNLSRRYLNAGEGNFNNTTEILDRWRSESNPGNGQIHRANRKASGNNARGSTFHMEDGDYIRLQNISIGYTFPDELFQNLQGLKLRLYMVGNNVFTWSKYTGYNPEVNLRGNSQLRPGVDYGVYPLARSFSFGVNLSF